VLVSGGTTYNLTGAPKFFSGLDHVGHVHKVALCHPVESTGPCNNAAICQYHDKAGLRAGTDLGTWLNKPIPTWTPLSSTNPSAGVVISFANGQAQCNEHPAYTNVRLECGDSKAAKTPTLIVGPLPNVSSDPV
jgi:hypothetical protein